MNFSKEFKETKETIGNVFSNRKYFFIFLITSAIVFLGLSYFMVAKVANNDLNIAFMMSGASYIWGTIITSFFIAILFGIYLALVSFKFSSGKKVGFTGFIGGFVGALGVGCPTCGALLFGLFGAPLALMYLPFRGLELRILGIIILIASVYFVSKSLNSECKIGAV